MHAVCTEVTGQILGERRQRLLHDLATVGGQLGDERGDRGGDVPARWTATRSTCRSPPSTSSGPGERGFAGSRRWAATPTLLPEVAGIDGRGLRRARRPARRHRRPLRRPGHRGRRPAAHRHAGTASRSALLLAGRSPNLALDAEYRSFYELVAGAVRRRRGQHPRLRGRAAAGGVARRARPGEDHLLLRRQPRAADAADAAARPDRRRPRRHRRAAAGRPCGSSCSLALRNGQRLQRLVNDLLDFASIEAGRASPVRVETDVATFTAELAGIFRAAAERAGLRLTVDCPPLGRPGLRRPADVGEGRRQPAGERGQVHVRRRHRRRACAPTDDGFVLTVSDTGVGHRRPRSCRTCSSASTGWPARPPAPARAPASGWRWSTSWPPCTAAPSSVDQRAGRRAARSPCALPYGAPGRRRGRGSRPSARRRPPAARRRAGSEDTSRPAEPGGGPRRRRRPRRRRQRRHARLPDPAARPALDGADDGERRGGAARRSPSARPTSC